MSDADLYQANGLNQQVVGQRSRGHLPGPFKALRQGSEGEVMSDLQRMLAEEKKQHMDAYGYQYGRQP